MKTEEIEKRFKRVGIWLAGFELCLWVAAIFIQLGGKFALDGEQPPPGYVRISTLSRFSHSEFVTTRMGSIHDWIVLAFIAGFLAFIPLGLAMRFAEKFFGTPPGPDLRDSE